MLQPEAISLIRESGVLQIMRPYFQMEEETQDNSPGLRLNLPGSELGDAVHSHSCTVCSLWGRASFMTKTVPCGNELHKFLIWDTAGQERFHSLAPMYYRGSAAAVIVYDITKQDSFYTLKKWVKELKEHGPENIVMAIAGNKCDLSDIREVPLKDAKEYAESIGAIVVETSAKNAINIEELFQGISRQIPPLDPHENGNNGGIKIGKPSTQAGPRCC
ncbi:ras-related protein Rab-31 isoform X1 [Equus quagga]|uniref:ras-related protein Rab-31 isoform X1 n=1 Tax=Equus quagga TaxID=89248 RepID=UPI001EE245F1|nr:ras-related protein Rab-31 isoform X1 [Equus quagga]